MPLPRTSRVMVSLPLGVRSPRMNKVEGRVRSSRASRTGRQGWCGRPRRRDDSKPDRAAEELVRRYEATVRLAVRVRLDQSELRRLFDSTDICQSVLGTFFVRAASGQFQLDTPEQLVKLLVTMARNKLINHAHQQRAA